MTLRPRAKGLLLIVLATVAIPAFAVWFWWATTPPDDPLLAAANSASGSKPGSPASKESADGKIERAVRPALPPADYVGDQACAVCHEEIAGRFAGSAMGRSLARVYEDSTLETLEDEVVVRSKGKCVYRVKQVAADGLAHHEQMVDQDGQLIYDLAVPIHYSMGSGTRGRSYLTNHNGILWMSALTWYASGNRWDLSPGFSSDDLRGFRRRVIDECLGCHVGRVATAGDSRYAAQPFLQQSIGCENCHGPGKQHVLAREGKLPPARDNMVNPARLPLAERDSVCNQCHLQGEARIPRYGRTYFDFRPGQRLEETLVVLLAGTGVAGGKTESVRHVQQMMASRCYEASKGRLGCISCHDAHATIPAEDAAAYYRRRCLACHDQADCHAPADERTAKADSCYACHMPPLPAADIAHTAQTDHRVLARPAAPAPATGLPAPERVVFFDNADARLPPWEATRARGLAAVKQLLEQGQSGGFAAIESLLAPVLEVAPDDTRVLIALVEMALKENDLAAAEKYAQAALAVDPQHEGALVAMTQVCYQDGRYAEGLQYSDRALAINPHMDTLHARRADLLRLAQRLPEGILAAEQALALNPRLMPVRQWLINAYRDQGQTAKSEEQRQILERIRSAPAAR
jgi:tetratricopeptide (TPR) repeat protein